MKYLVNRETKEHIRKHEAPSLLNTNAEWLEVPADPEGWIKHDGGECPLPDWVMCDVKYRCGGTAFSLPANKVSSFEIDASPSFWDDDGMGYDIIAYRPILDDKPVKSTNIRRFENVTDTTSAFPPDLITRLRASHKAASELPDIIAELREVLEPMGLGIHHLSVFAESADYENPVVEPESTVDATQDMADWRNWRGGDTLECIKQPISHGDEYFTIGELYTYCADFFGMPRTYCKKGFDLSHRPDDFRFHSRPTTQESKP